VTARQEGDQEIRRFAELADENTRHLRSTRSEEASVLTLFCRNWHGQNLFCMTASRLGSGPTGWRKHLCLDRQ